MLLSNYNINKALLEINDNPTILVSILTDDLISICDKQNFNWEDDPESKEYKFLQMLSSMNNESYTLSILNKFFYIIYIEICKYESSNNDHFSLIDDFDAFIKDNNQSYDLVGINAFIAAISDYDEDYNKYMILRCINIINDPYSIKQSVTMPSTMRTVPEHFLLSPQLSYSSRYGNKYLNNAEDIYFETVENTITKENITSSRYKVLDDIKNKILNTNKISSDVSINDLSSTRVYEEPLLLYKPGLKHQFSNNDKINSLLIDIMNITSPINVDNIEYSDGDILKNNNSSLGMKLTDGDFDIEFDSFLRDILMFLEEKEINITELYSGLYTEKYGNIGDDNYHYDISANSKIPTAYNVIKNNYSGDDRYVGFPELKQYEFLLWYTICEKRYNKDYTYDIICRPANRKDSQYIVPVFYQTEKDGPFYKYPEGTEIPKVFLSDENESDYYYKNTNNKYLNNLIRYSRTSDFFCTISNIVFNYLNTGDISEDYRKYIFYYNIKDFFKIQTNNTEYINVYDLMSLKQNAGVEINDNIYFGTIVSFTAECCDIQSILNNITTELLKTGKFKRVVDY